MKAPVVPIITISGSRLGNDQAMAVALAVRHVLDHIKTDKELREKCKGYADSLEFDLNSVMLMFSKGFEP